MFCTSCGKSVPDDSRHCPECGEKLEPVPVRQHIPHTAARPQATRMKRCPQCGGRIPADSRFCPECAADLSAVTERTCTAGSQGAGAATAARVVAEPKTPEQLAAERKRNKILAIGLGGALALCLVIAILASVIKPGINLNKYVTVSFEGYDTIGEAKATFDYDRFYADYEEKLAAKLEAKAKQERKKNRPKDLESMLQIALFGADSNDSYSYHNACQTFLDMCVRGELDKQSDLTNGDSVNYSWDCNDETALKEFGYKLKHQDMVYTVEGLQEAGEFDPFEGLQLRYGGIAPNGQVRFDGDLPRSFYYKMEPQDGLSNGDRVTITISVPYSDEDLNRYCLRTYGALPSATKKEFTVSELSSYVQTVSDLSEECLQALDSQAQDVFKARAAKEWESGAKLKEQKYIGNYLLTSKNPNGYGNRNMLYMVYHVKVKNTYSNEDKKYDKVNEFYWFIRFRDIVKNADGTNWVDLTSFDVVNHTLKIDSGLPKNSWSNKVWEFRGFKKLDDLYSNVVTENLENYNGEENVSDS